VGVAGLAACGGEHRKAPATEAPALEVQAETVRMAAVPVTVTAVGTTEPYARATPGTRLMGRVGDVTVSEGDRVRKGAVMVRIEHQDLSAKRRQAESGLQEARAVLANAETSLKRIENLFRENAVPKKSLDEARTGHARAKAMVSAAEGALREVEANLGYSVIASSLDGVIVRKFVQPGDMAAPGAPLFTVEQQDPMKVTVEVGERDLVYVRVDSPVVVEIEALHHEGPAAQAERVGTVEAVVPSADPGSRTFQVKVVLRNPERSVRSGMFARVRFQKDDRPGMLIPTSAVIREGQLQGVYVVSEDRARLRWVRLGKVFGERTEVISGLSPGDVVIVSAQSRISDGSRVDVKDDA
jgi:RND family efflux transporter MFP subunit